MHFYYLDESGCTGTNLADADQPIFVLGGVSVRDGGWNQTLERLDEILSSYFGGIIPRGFELHTNEMLSLNGKGFFKDHDIELRKRLAKNLLALLRLRKHHIQFFSIDKQKLTNAIPPENLNYGGYDLKIPYFIAYDYMLTHVHKLIQGLGRSARGMLIIDHKEGYYDFIDTITNFRRSEDIAAHRLKRIAEHKHPVDSKESRMIQLSDLVIFCVRKFLEIESGHRDRYPPDVKQFFAECYQMIDSRNQKKNIIDRKGRGMDALNDYLKAIQAKPSSQWKQKYNL